MNIDMIVNALREAFPDETIEPRTVPLNDVFLRIPLDGVGKAVRMLVERFGLGHLSAITGLDNGAEIEILYHFWDGQGLTLHTALARDAVGPDAAPHAASITDIVPGAAYYELEVTEMLGVVFDGHPGPAVLLLPDDWTGGPPLRREEGST